MPDNIFPYFIIAFFLFAIGKSVYNFIEKQNGEIGVNSSLNQGSTFYFKLPLV